MITERYPNRTAKKKVKVLEDNIKKVTKKHEEQ